MTIIKPISELRNNFNEISEICHQDGKPVYITKNGIGDLVVMSIAKFEQIEALLDLYDKLDIAETESANCDDKIEHSEVIDKLRKQLHEIS